MIRALAGFLATAAIAASMLSTGLMTTRAVASQVREHIPLRLRALLAVWIVVPLLALAATVLFRTPPVATAGLLLIAICPGVPLLLRSTAKVHGSTTTALLVLLATAITAPALIPAWAAILARVTPYAFVVDARDVTEVLLPTVFIPFVVGRLIWVFSARPATFLARFAAGLVVLVVAIVARSSGLITSTPVRAYAAVIALTLAAAAGGHVLGGARLGPA